MTEPTTTAGPDLLDEWTYPEQYVLGEEDRRHPRRPARGEAVTPAERKAVRRMVDQASDLYAASMGNALIWPNRDRMRESIGQFVSEQMALLDTPGMLAEWLIEDATP